MLKTAAFAPIPSARVPMTVRDMNGRLASDLVAKRTSINRRSMSILS
jgi:hypothetical protein